MERDGQFTYIPTVSCSQMSLGELQQLKKLQFIDFKPNAVCTKNIDLEATSLKFKSELLYSDASSFR